MVGPTLREKIEGLVCFKINTRPRTVCVSPPAIRVANKTWCQGGPPAYPKKELPTWATQIVLCKTQAPVLMGRKWIPHLCSCRLSRDALSLKSMKARRTGTTKGCRSLEAEKRKKASSKLRAWQIIRGGFSLKWWSRSLGFQKEYRF